MTTEVDCNSHSASDLNLLKFWGGKKVALILCLLSINLRKTFRSWELRLLKKSSHWGQIVNHSRGLLKKTYWNLPFEQSLGEKDPWIMIFITSSLKHNKRNVFFKCHWLKDTHKLKNKFISQWLFKYLSYRILAKLYLIVWM